VPVALPSVPDDKTGKLKGQTEKLTVPLSQTVGEFKEALQALTGLAAGKINLKHSQWGLLKDHLSLAHYNLDGNSELQLLIRERGGRKK